MHADSFTAFGGGSGLALWDLPSEERKAKYTGHPVGRHRNPLLAPKLSLSWSPSRACYPDSSASLGPFA